MAGVLPDAEDVQPRDTERPSRRDEDEASFDLADSLAAAGTQFRGSIGTTEVET